jgi:hypothetical protein
MINTFTPFQQSVIDSLIALHGGRRPAADLRDYFTAFDGRFDGGRPFTLNTPAANKLILYYDNARLPCSNFSRERFKEMCEKIKRRFDDIAQFILFLINAGCIEPDFKPPDYGAIPDRFVAKWRKYQEFTVEEAQDIILVKSINAIPTEKLLSIEPVANLIGVLQQSRVLSA